VVAVTTSALTAAEVMLPAPPTVGMDATMAQVRSVLDGTRIQHVVVVEDAKVVGVIGDTDVLAALSPNLRTASETDRDLATLAKRAHQVMIRHPLVATPDTSVAELIATFRTSTIGCLPIVDGDQALLGLVTPRSLLFALYPG
jgi:acetoin utilization protein AcuB